MANKKQKITSFNYRSVESQLLKIAASIGVDITEWGGMGQVLEYAVLKAYENLKPETTAYVYCKSDEPGAFKVFFPDKSGESRDLGWYEHFKQASLGDIAQQLIDKPHYSIFVETDEVHADCYYELNDENDPAGIVRRQRGTDKIFYTEGAITFVPKIALY